MKKRMFLSTILMTLVLLVAVTTATFAWYTATLNTSEANVTIATMKNEAAGASMTTSMTVYSVGSSGKSQLATYVDQNAAGEDTSLEATVDKTVARRVFALPTVDGGTKFLPVSNNPAADARTAAGAQVAGEANLGEGKFKSYIQQSSATDYLYDYYEDTATKGLAAISFTFTIAGDANATAQKLAIKLEIAGVNAGQPTNWAVATSADSYAKVYQGQTAMYVAVDFAQAASDTTYTVWVWLNGCAHQNSQAAADNVKFTFTLVPYNSAAMALPTVEAQTLATTAKA